MITASEFSPARRFVLAAALLFTAHLLPLVSAFGANPIELSLNQVDGRYSVGETAVVTVAVASEVLESRLWNGNVAWQRNWTGEPETREWSPAQPLIRFPLQDEDPGQFTVTVTLQAADDPSVTHQQMIGFLYRPEAIELSTPEPEDFDAFWDDQKKAWRALEQEIVLRPVESPVETVDCWDLTIQLEGETPVSGYLAIPKNSSPKTLPAILDVHGAGVRSSILATAAKAAEKGFLALDINAHGLPNGMPSDFYQEKNQGELSNYRYDGVESRETWYFRKMYLRVLTALDYLSERPEWNGKDLVLRGSSQGGGQALAGAGLDPRVSVVAASVPALCDLTGDPESRRAGWPQPAESATGEAVDRTQVATTVGYFDGGIFARRIQAPTIVSLGLVDRVCPALGIQATVNNLGGSAVAIYRPAMAHAFPPDLKEDFEEFILRHVTLPAAAAN